MRRSALQGKDGNAHDSPAFSGKLAGGGFGVPRFAKDFKPPTPLNLRRAITANGECGSSTRKRKRVSYKGQDGAEEEDPSDHNTPSPAGSVRQWGKFHSKSLKRSLTSKFTIPEMRNKDGQVIVTRFTDGALGVCRRATPLPRPLHNPLDDHAIVLFDPTVDDPQAKEAATAEAEKRQQELRDAEQNGPHKSLAAMLGLDKKVDPNSIKVAVVIDPKLSRILRPHQIEGVKFLYKATTEKIAAGALGCIMADEMGLDKCPSFRPMQKSYSL